MQMADAFTRAYKDGQWHNGSGSGSSPGNTRAYRAYLQSYLKDRRIRSVLDIGCGDWQFSRLIDWTGIDYAGVDVVPELVTANTLRFGGPSVMFAVADALGLGRLPAADLIVCKDLLQHWPDAAVRELGRRLAGRRALLTYDLAAPGGHADTGAGGYRPLDLTAAPFRWPALERLRYESVSHEGRVRRVKVVMEVTG
jgi:SAM-dependent methyltransferase